MTKKIAFTLLAFLLMLSYWIFFIKRSPKLCKWKKIIFSTFIVMWISFIVLFGYYFFGRRPFFKAVEANDYERVKKMLTKNPSLINSYHLVVTGETALHIAAKKENEELVDFLIQHGAKVNARDFSRVTPLHLAAENGNLAIAKKLLKNGAYVNARAYHHDNTPLHLAAFLGHLNMVKLLIDNGANIDEVDGVKKTALDLAEDFNQPDVVNFLKEYKNKNGIIVGGEKSGTPPGL